MDNNVAEVDQDPVTGAQTFDSCAAKAGLLDVIEEPIGDRTDVSMRSAGGNHHVVGEGRTPGNVDGNEFLGLGIVEAAKNHFKDRRGRWALLPRAGRAGAGFSAAWLGREGQWLGPFAVWRASKINSGGWR